MTQESGVVCERASGGPSLSGRRETAQTRPRRKDNQNGARPTRGCEHAKGSPGTIQALMCEGIKV